MSILSDYIKELGLKEVHETESGFLSYRIIGSECYIDDIYVRPANRRSREAFRLADHVFAVAKEKGCKLVFGFVPLNSKTATESLKAQLAYGFRLFRSDKDQITLMKEL